MEGGRESGDGGHPVLGKKDLGPKEVNIDTLANGCTCLMMSHISML